MRSSELEKLLHEIGLEGRVDSSGKFTLATEALRQKFANFQFEGPSQWVLKVIQALVGAKVDSCDIRSSYQRTEFLIHSSKCLFSADELEQAFLEPLVDHSSALWDLMSALWFLSFNLQVAWLWTNLNSDDAILWTGTQLERIKVEPTTFSILEISHPQSPKEGSWLSTLFAAASLSGPRGCADIARELVLRAYTCPFPLKFDGVRIDTLANCSTLKKPKPISGLSKVVETVFIAAVGWGEADAPRLGWPSGTEAQHFKNGFVATQQSYLAPHNPAWLAVTAFHLCFHTPDKRMVSNPFPVASRTSLVRRGVIVGEHDLPTNSGASCHLFVSADELKVDASGLRLVGEAPLLNPNIKASLLKWLKTQSVSFAVRKGDRLSSKDALVGMIALGGMCLVGGGPGLLAGVISLGIGLKVKGISLGPDDSFILEQNFRNELDDLVRELEYSLI